MSKFMIATSLMLFWAFYEMSGGADFEPPKREVVAEAPVVAPPEPQVTVVAAPDPTPVAEVIEVAYQPAQTAPETSEPVIEQVSLVVENEIAEEVATPEVALEQPDFRLVTGDWVNMRDGPSTDYSVLDTLPRGTEAEVIDINTDGWAQIRLTDTGQTGWMAERLLSDS